MRFDRRLNAGQHAAYEELAMCAYVLDVLDASSLRHLPSSFRVDAHNGGPLRVYSVNRDPTCRSFSLRCTQSWVS